MSLRDLLAPIFPRACTARRAAPFSKNVRRRSTFRLAVTVLEDRLAPALLTVNSLVDAPLSAVSATLSLREAIALVDTDGKAIDSVGNLLAPAKASQIDTTHPFGVQDTIQFAPNLFGASPQLISLAEGALVLNQSVTLQGPGAAQLAVNGNNQSLVFQVAGGATVNILGLTVEGGNAGGIVNDGTLALTNSIVAGNASSVNGGGIVNSGSLTLSGSLVSDNVAAGNDGGILNLGGTLTLIGSTVSGNSAQNNGGIANYGGTLTLSGSTVAGNLAQLNNGGITNYGGTLTLSDSTVSGNVAETLGNGGIANYSGTATLSDSTVSGNSAQGASGIGNYDGGTMTLTNCTVSANTSASMAGGIFNDGGTLTLIGSTLAGNVAGTDGGGILSIGGTLTLTGCTVSGNSAQDNGGIAEVGSTLTLTDSMVSGNADQNNGGNVNYPGTPTTSTVSDDTASARGVVPTVTSSLPPGSSATVIDAETVFVGMLTSPNNDVSGNVASVDVGALSTGATSVGSRTSNNSAPDLSGSLSDAASLAPASALDSGSPSQLPAAPPSGEEFGGTLDAAILVAPPAAGSTMPNVALVSSQETAPAPEISQGLTITDPATHAAVQESLFVGTPVADAAGTSLNQSADQGTARDTGALLDGYFAAERWEEMAVLSAGFFLFGAIAAPDLAREVAREEEKNPSTPGPRR